LTFCVVLNRERKSQDLSPDLHTGLIDASLKKLSLAGCLRSSALKLIGRRLAGTAVSRAFEANSLSLDETSHARPFNRADMDEDVRAAI
jgi:hypothetical protein